MYQTLKTLSLFLCLIVLFSGCKKDERTADEWGQLAEAKLKEIEALGENLSCQQQANVSIQEIATGCSSKLYPVLNSDVQTFNVLKEEYTDLLGKQAEAFHKNNPNVIIDPCWDVLWSYEQPIRLECKDNKVQLITTSNVSITEAAPIAENAYKGLMNYLNNQTCTDNAGWDYTAILNEKSQTLVYIPFSRKGDIRQLQRMASLYNSLILRIINDAETPATPGIALHRVKNIECLNGKPTIIMEE